ncbi:hypothetical protein [Streptomyces sp. NPDC058268]
MLETPQLRLIRARNAFLESHMLARHAGEGAMEWFALDMKLEGTQGMPS